MSGCDWCEDGEGAKLIERARVVGVLDAWTAKKPKQRSWYSNAYSCDLIDAKMRLVRVGVTGEEARSRAAEWVESEGV